MLPLLLFALVVLVAIGAAFGPGTALTVAAVVLAVAALAAIVGALVLRHLWRTRGPVFLAMMLARRMPAASAAMLAPRAARYFARRRRGIAP